jgi:hypothetical protein
LTGSILLLLLTLTIMDGYSRVKIVATWFNLITFYTIFHHIQVLLSYESSVSILPLCFVCVDRIVSCICKIWKPFLSF